jgi:transposase
VIPLPLKRGRPRADDRRTLEGILYVLRNGCRWQDTPKQFGSAITCWRRFAQWEADGTWERVWLALWSQLEPAGRHVWARALLDCARVPTKPGRPRSAALRARQPAR